MHDNNQIIHVFIVVFSNMDFLAKFRDAQLLFAKYPIFQALLCPSIFFLCRIEVLSM